MFKTLRMKFLKKIRKARALKAKQNELFNFKTQFGEENLPGKTGTQTTSIFVLSKFRFQTRWSQFEHLCESCSGRLSSIEFSKSNFLHSMCWFLNWFSVWSTSSASIAILGEEERLEHQGKISPWFSFYKFLKVDPPCGEILKWICSITWVPKFSTTAEPKRSVPVCRIVTGCSERVLNLPDLKVTFS